MIEIYLNKPEFEYDIHSLIKAFFPKDNVEIYYTDDAEIQGKNLACTAHEVSKMEQNGKKLQGETEDTEKVQETIRVNYGKKEITLDWTRVELEENYHSSFAVDFSDRIQVKNKLKQELYGFLAEGCKETLPWGTLTGIRPTKIPMKLLNEGVSEEEIGQYMKDTYLASEEKINLSIDIAKRERKLLEKIDYENGYSLYIGIPFCPSTCLYCSFTSYPLAAWSSKVDRYLDALEKELTYVATKFYHKKLNSIYIGGGTPTTLNPAQLDRLIRKIKCSFDLSHCVEFTVEAGRPDSITRDKLQVLKQHGVERISINPQTMKQETLDLLGRRHTVEQIKECYKMARDLGFDNINMDLILGLPKETLEDVRHTMEELIALEPENITIHSLAIKRAARLNIFKDYYKDMEMVNTKEHMDLCQEYCEKIGLYPYYLYRQKGMAGNMENVGYAKEGKAGVYNILIMEEVQTIVACGAGATTKRVWPTPEADGTHRIERCENVKDVGQYMDRIDEMIVRKQRLFAEA